VNLGAFGSAGGYAGGPGYGAQYPGSSGSSVNATFGAFAGGGIGWFFTNANSASQLWGPFETSTINVGEGSIQVSIQIGFSGGTWIVSVTLGPGIGASVSSYPTNTWTTGCPQTP